MISVPVRTAGEMRSLGRRLASVLREGDLVILSGPLGAGKTTLTQGIADGLGVRGPITSPTFVIARVHPPLRGSGDSRGPGDSRGSGDARGSGDSRGPGDSRGSGDSRGPALVHADAYRLGSVLELDDLDLDADLANSVTVVEWGEGLAEGLSEDRLEIHITPAGPAGVPPTGTDGDCADTPRAVSISGIGLRWQDIQLPPAEDADRL